MKATPSSLHLLDNKVEDLFRWDSVPHTSQTPGYAVDTIVAKAGGRSWNAGKEASMQAFGWHVIDLLVLVPPPLVYIS